MGENVKAIQIPIPLIIAANSTIEAPTTALFPAGVMNIPSKYNNDINFVKELCIFKGFAMYEYFK